MLDLRVRPEGFVPLYAWDLRIEPGRTAKLSDLVLRRGASLVGRVEIEEGTSAASAEVVLEPAVSDPAARARLAGRMQTLSFRATTNQRGFYQIVGPPEGAYEVRASLSDYGVSDSIRATFDGPVEHTAEVLTIPFFPAAVVRVQPPVAPGGDPWTVRTLDPTGQQHSATTDPDGRAVFEVPKAGRYTAIVEDGDGGRWAMRSAELDRENPELLIEIDEVPVIGTVSLDGEPLPATLCFGGCSGGESIRVETDTDGAFTGVLSREGSWALEIQAEEPFVRQVFSAYPVELDEGLGAAELVIELPGTAIGGKVVDSLGQPVEGARLIVQARSSAGGTMQLASDPEGSFRLQGQPYGRYSVEAIHRRRRSASPEVVELSEDEPEATVEIVLGDPIELVGRVVTLSGEPVAGATIWPLGPADAEGPALTVPAVTGPDGDFELPVPPRGASAAVAVLANGFVLGIAEIPTATATSEPPTIRLFPEGGGSLQLIGEENGGAGSLVYEGRWRLDPALLTTWARRNGSPGGGPGRQDLTVPQLPSGSYRFCTTDRSGTRASCRSGYLSSSSSLILEPRKETR